MAASRYVPSNHFLNLAFLLLYSALGERWLGLLDILLLDGCIVWRICDWEYLGSGGKGTRILQLSLGKLAWGLLPYGA